MGTTVAGMIKRLSGLNFGQEAIDAIIETEDDYLQLNTEQQLQYGTDNTGNSIQPTYKNKYYAKKKNIMNPLPGMGVPDLKVSGEFYKQLKFADVDKQHIEIASDVDYAKYIEKNYGTAIYGLDNNNRPRYTFGAFFETLKLKIETITGLTFK